MLGGVRDHLGQVSILVLSHLIEAAVPAHNPPHILGAGVEHEHVVAVGGQLAEYDVLFSQECLRVGLAFLHIEVYHFLIS